MLFERCVSKGPGDCQDACESIHDQFSTHLSIVKGIVTVCDWPQTHFNPCASQSVSPHYCRQTGTRSNHPHAPCTEFVLTPRVV